MKIDGINCKKIEDLGVQGGYRAILVRLPDGTEKVAVRRGYWSFWEAKDRVAPLLHENQNSNED